MSVPAHSQVESTSPERASTDTLSLMSEIKELHNALESRPLIEQAKGILMGRYRVDAAGAYEIIRRWSMDSNIKVRDISAALVQISVLGGRTQPEPSARALRVVRQQLRRPA